MRRRRMGPQCSQKGAKGGGALGVRGEVPTRVVALVFKVAPKKNNTALFPGMDGARRHLCCLTSAFCRTALSAQRRSGGVGQQRAVRCHECPHLPASPL